MQEILNWLDSERNYDDGVDLYLKHGKNDLLKKLFTAEDYSDFKAKKLLEALKSLLNGNPEPVKVVEPKNENPNPYTKQVAWPAPVPNENVVITALYNQFKPLYQEMMNLQARLYDVAVAGQNDLLRKQDACDTAHRIVELDEVLEDLYSKRDFYLKHGHLPGDDSEIPVVAAAQWPLKLANHKKYVRDYKAKLKKDPTNENIAAQLHKHEQLVEHYKKLLNQ